MEIVYIDTLLFLNFAVNYLLLLATAKISCLPISRWRIAGGAFLGATYAVLSVLPQFGFFLLAPMRIVSGVFMVLLVFGGQKSLLRLSLIFFAVSAAFGGMIFALSLMAEDFVPSSGFAFPVSMQVLIASFLLCYGAITLVFQRMGRNTGQKLIALKIVRDGKNVSLSALVDTGNSLTDPISGGGVFVLEARQCLPLFSLEVGEILGRLSKENPVDLLEKLRNSKESPRFYLIPYTAIGVSSGFMLAFRADKVYIDQKENKAKTVALSPTPVSDGGRYAALASANVL